MGYGNYLTRSRHQTNWYARIAIPRDLREQFKRQREIRKTLDTTCKATAKRRAMAVWLAYQSVFDALRNGLPVKDLNPDWGALAGLSAPTLPHEATLSPRHTAQESDTGSHGSAPADDEFVLHYMGTDYRGAKLEVDYGSPQADLAAITALMDEIDNRCHHRASLPLPQAESASTMQPQSQPKRTFAQAADDYIEQYRSNREYDGSLRDSSYDKTKRAVAFWKYYFEGVRLDEIDITVCGRAERDCRNYPKNIDSAIAAQLCREHHGQKTTGVQATKTRLKTLQNIFAHAIKHQWVKSDPTLIIDTRQRRGSSDTDKEPFTIKELQAIFPGPDYGVDFFPKRATRDRQYDAAKFWIPLIAAFTGARLGEIIQLELNDIKQDESGAWYFHITTESDDKESGKELKTASSRRRVPIHPQLMEIGLMDYVKERQQHASKPTGLFDHYCQPPRPKGAKVTTWFKGGSNGKDRNGNPRLRSGYLDRRGLKTNPEQRGTQTSISFHSFRHAFTDAARQKQFPSGDWIRDDDTQWVLVLGHGRMQSTGRYGHGQSVEFLQIIVEAITYDGVDFAAIKWSEFKRRWDVKAVNS